MKSGMFLLLFVLSVAPIRAGTKVDDTDKKCPSCLADIESLSFFENRQVVPVQFISFKNNELVAHFASKFVVQQFEFCLPEKTENVFFKLVDKDWGEGIGRKEFLKKFKKNFWLVTYFSQETTDQDGSKKTTNIICQASEFKDWGSIFGSYGHDPENKAKAIDTLAYWQDVRTTLVYFKKLRKDEADWLFLKALNPQPKDFDDKVEQLDPGNPEKQIRYKVLERGTFKIDQHTVFNIIETKELGPSLMSKLPLIDAEEKVRMRAKPVDRMFFDQNYKKTLWMCFYEKNTGLLLRLIGDPMNVIKRNI